MSQIRNFIRKFIKGLLKFILFTAVILLMILGGIIVALQFPSVQTKLVNKAAEVLSETINFPISIEGVDISWFDEIVLEGVSVLDPQKGNMVYLQEAVVDFEIISIPNGKFNIDEITLRNGRVNVIKYAPDGNLNFTDFLDALRNLSAPREKGKKPVPFTIGGFRLENMFFSYSDNRKTKITEGFDHNHFVCDSIYATVKDFRVVADTFQINVSKLRTIEPNIHLRVHELNTNFMLTKGDMTFDNLYARIGESTVQDYLRLNYNHINDLSDFNEKIDIISYLNKAEINFKDLSKFAPGLKPFRDNIKLSGSLKGKVENFDVNNFTLEFGKSSLINGSVSFNGLPDFEETAIDFKFSNTTIQAGDMKQYLNNNSYFILKKFGKISGSGRFTGFPYNFVTQGSFNTDLGRLVSDINLDAKNENEKPTYKGRLKTYSFNLGKLMDIPDVQLIDMDGKINGAGFSLENAEVNIDASITRIDINNYNYKNIKTNAKLTNRLFNGEISVNDSNLVFEAKGKIDLTKDKEIFDIKAHFEKANLKPLNLSHVETLIKTDLELNFQGTRIDDIIGEATFKNTYLLYKNNREIFVDSLYASSIQNGEERIIDIKSDLATLHASGNFLLSSLSNDIQRLYKEYMLNIINDKASISNYYEKKITRNLRKYNIEFDVNIKNLNNLFEIYVPGLYLSQGLTIEGNFTNGNTSILNINTHIDTLFYKGNEIYNTNIDLATSKLADSSNVLAMLYINSARQKLDKIPETKNFTFEGIWDKRIIDFGTAVYQANTSNNINLNGNLSFLDNNKILKLKNSSVNILNKTWNIQDNNKVEFSKKEIYFENFTIANNNQSVSLNGIISDDAKKIAELKVVDFEVGSLNSLLTTSLGGTLNGDVFIKDLYRDLDLSGNIDLNNLTIDGFLVGNVKGVSEWDNSNHNLKLNLQVERSNVVTINLKGDIKPASENKKEELNLEASLDNADLEVLAPVLKGVMSDLSGKVTGNFNIKGSFSDIALSGKGHVKKGRFKIDYLGTTYYFDDHIYLEENKIGFKRLKLKDEYGNIAIINGGITHDGFKKFIVDIKGELNEVNALNTTEKDNKLFYGSAFVTGDMEIRGPFSNLLINVNASSNKGTKIYIPLNTYEGLEQQSYISFKSRKQAEEEAKQNKKHVDLSGIELNFNFELTPDAYAEIIFDKRAGDIIRGYGSGNIKMNIDTRGDFNMYGTYRIASGKYNYTLAGLINKEFTIDPGSSISWSGDPYGALLDVKAFYENNYSLVPLDTSIRISEAGRRHPVKVILELDGNLMSPEITMDIDIHPTTQEANNVALKFESDIKRNEQELNRQVFGLLVLGSFFSQNSSFTGSAEAGRNVSQLLTNQLSSWLSQVDENLIVDIDLNLLDKEALNTFNLRLSYTLLEGRLRISRDGTFSNFQNTNQQSVGNIAGEWTVEYLLSKEGKFRLKLFNKNNNNVLLNSLNAGNNSSAGFSLLHTQNFCNLNELLGIKPKK